MNDINYLNKIIHIILPTTSLTTTSEKNLSKLNTKYLTTSKAIRDLITRKQNSSNPKPESRIYTIACNDITKIYRRDPDEFK